MANRQGWDKTKLACMVCGKPLKDDIPSILLHNEKWICGHCVQNLGEALQAAGNKQAGRGGSDMQKSSCSRPSAIKKFLDQYIIGQEQAKEILAVAIYNHYKRLRLLGRRRKEERPGTECVELEKSNVLFIGPTGSGKTYMLRTLAKQLKIPFVATDATSYTSSGYVGKDVESMLRELVEAADGNIEAAQYGMVYIDEIDKISRKGENLSTTADPGHEGTQQALLKMLEGSVVEVPEKGMRRHPEAPVIRIDTTNILFVVGGCFEGIEKIISRRQHRHISNMGFNNKLQQRDESCYNDYILDVRVEDLKKFGMLPEFLGRLPVIAPLQELDEEALVRILTEPKNALVRQYAELFRADRSQLVFTEKALRAVAREAMERKTGARSLRGILERILTPVMFRLPDIRNCTRVVVGFNEKIKDFETEVISTDNGKDAKSAG